jgi:hypothetical protein
MSSKNMSLTVNVTVTAATDSQGNVTGLAATYALGSSDPQPIAGQTVVNANGTINLNALNKVSGNFKDNTDISWNFVFPSLPVGSISLFSPKSQSIAIQPWDKDMVPSDGGTSNQLCLEDKGKANASYTYGILLAWQPAAGTLPQLFLLDPGIVNRRP